MRKPILSKLILLLGIVSLIPLAGFHLEENQSLPDQILYVSREQYLQDHHNTATLFQTGEINTQSFRPGAALKIYNTQTKTSEILFETDEGMLRDPELSFDAQKIIFSYRRDITDDYHIYELEIASKNLRQLSFGSGISDIDPLYLPDGSIAFSSSREPKYCMCNRHIMANLFKMDADGNKIRQLGRSTLFEGHAALMNDGRIIYDRWEYIDRNFGDAQGLWTVNPDGTKHAIYYGNNMNSPGGVIDPRPIPGSNNILCIFGSCHDRPWGALTLLDRSKGVDGEAAVVQIWPSMAREYIGKGNWDQFMNLPVRYEDPFPIDENNFLVSKSVFLDKPGAHPLSQQMGVYLVHADGQEELLFIDDQRSCFDPMPVRARAIPPIIPDKTNSSSTTGQFYVSDVYTGTHMEGIQPGSVKYLRVVESPPKRTWTHPSWGGQGQQAPGVNWHSFENKKILGTVPVESDGSSFFEAPAGVYLYFQLLDENKKMLHSMRSGITVQPGEINGCIGCHEDRLSAPVNVNKMPMAIRKAPHTLDGWMGEQKTFNYATEVQPVFDRHCVSCHDFGPENKSGLILAGDKNAFFNASYIDLHVKKMIHTVGGGPSDIQQALSWGSHPSKLIQVLEQGHQGVQLTQNEFERLYTWIDLNGVYYPEYESAYPDHPAGRSPITHDELKELGQLCGTDFYKLKTFDREIGPLISFDRPEISPCLAKIADKKEYQRALQIITIGKDRLSETPRCDMPGFVPSPLHQQMLAKYNHLMSNSNLN